MEDEKVDDTLLKCPDDKKEILGIGSEKESKNAKKSRPKRRKRGFHEEMFKETSYYFKDGLQFVFPYSFTFVAHVKGRWLNLTILELFRKEFHMETMEYYEKAIKVGKVKVNNQVVNADRILTSNDIVNTTVHRHEPPVIHQPIEFLQNDEDMVVINKPPSIPVHPCGRYRHNTIVFILGKLHNLHGLYTIHRIDRLTSGILMFAKTASKAREMESQMHHKRNVEKEYFARVVGEFPSGVIDVNEPILTLSHKIGVCQVHPDGKPCSTKFKLIKYNGKSSLVRCKPQTGRMHQIRVHLQWLGFPIINDPIYNHPTAWVKSNGVYNIDEVILELIRTRKDKTYDNDSLNTNKSVSNDIEVNRNDELVSQSNQFLSCPKKRKVSMDQQSGIKDHISEDNISGIKVHISEDHISGIKDHISEDHISGIKDHISGIKDHISEDHILGIKDHISGIKDHISEEIDSPCASGTENDNNIKCDNDDSKCNQYQESLEVINQAIPSSTVDESTAENKDSAIEDGNFYYSSDIGDQYVDEDCVDCKRKWKQPLLSELIMYLHSFHYKGPDWEYKTSIPKWACEDWITD